MFFFFNDTATTEIYTLSLHDALPISPTVQWQVSTDNGATFNNVSAATSTTLSFTTALPQNGNQYRSEEHTSELQSHFNIASLLLLEKQPHPPSGTATLQNTNSNLCIN